LIARLVQVLRRKETSIALYQTNLERKDTQQLPPPNNRDEKTATRASEKSQ